MHIVLILLLLISILLEGVQFTLPLVLVSLLVVTVYRRDSVVFFIAFLAGLFLDAFLLRPMGATSIFFLVFVVLILLYQRKYEINSYPFIFFAAFLGSGIYLMIFGYSVMWLQAGISAFLAIMLFGAVRYGYQTKFFHKEEGLHYK